MMTRPIVPFRCSSSLTNVSRGGLSSLGKVYLLTRPIDRASPQDNEKKSVYDDTADRASPQGL
jgi:hypothetical protein